MHKTLISLSNFTTRITCEQAYTKIYVLSASYYYNDFADLSRNVIAEHIGPETPISAVANHCQFLMKVKNFQQEFAMPLKIDRCNIYFADLFRNVLLPDLRSVAIYGTQTWKTIWRTVNN